MFHLFKKKKLEKEKKMRKDLCVNINESILKTKDGTIIRCTNITTHFNIKTEALEKKISHDMVRQALITSGYLIGGQEAVGNKEKLAELVHIELNKMIAAEPFLCTAVTIENINIVEVK